MNILELPDCVLDIIMSYLTFDDIAKSRIVSKSNQKLFPAGRKTSENFSF